MRSAWLTFLGSSDGDDSSTVLAVRLAFRQTISSDCLVDRMRPFRSLSSIAVSDITLGQWALLYRTKPCARLIVNEKIPPNDITWNSDSASPKTGQRRRATNGLCYGTVSLNSSFLRDSPKAKHCRVALFVYLAGRMRTDATCLNAEASLFGLGFYSNVRCGLGNTRHK